MPRQTQYLAQMFEGEEQEQVACVRCLIDADCFMKQNAVF